MNVALLFFGQLRHINNPHAEFSHKEYIISRYDVDVFAHTWWSENEKVYDGTPYERCGDPLVDEYALDKFKLKYNPLVLKTEPSRSFKQFSDPFERRCHAGPYNKNQAPGLFGNHKAFNGIFSHFYSFEQVGQLFIDYVKETGKKYDFVIMSRPDMCMLDYPNLNNLDSNYFYLSNHRNNFPDLQFVFGPKFINFTKIYSNLFEITNEELYALNLPTPEALKFLNYKKHFSLDLMKGVYLPARIVRDDYNIGPHE